MVELAFSSYCHALFGLVQCKAYYKIDRMAFPHTFLRHLMGPRDLLIYRPAHGEEGHVRLAGHGLRLDT